MKKGNDAVDELQRNFDEESEPLRMHVHLKEILKSRNMSQRELAKLTDIRPAAISELANNQRTTINREHVERIARVLKIERLDELITFELESELWTMGTRKEQTLYLDDNPTQE